MSGSNQHGQKRIRSGDDDLGSALLPQQGASPLAELELLLRLQQQSSNRLQAPQPQPPQPPSGQNLQSQSLQLQIQIQNLQAQLQVQQAQQSQVQPQQQLSTAGISLGQVNAPNAAATQQSQQQSDLQTALASLGLATGGNGAVRAGNSSLLNLGGLSGFAQAQPQQQVSQPQANSAHDLLQQLAQLQQNQAPAPRPRGLAGLCLPIGNKYPAPAPLPTVSSGLQQTLQASGLDGNLATLLLIAQAQGNQAQAPQPQANVQPSNTAVLELLRQLVNRPAPPAEVNTNMDGLQALLQNAFASNAPAASLPPPPPNAASVPSAAVQAQEPTAKRPKHNQSHLVDNSNTKSVLLYMPSDDDSISPYQAYARQQVELFEAQEVDVSTGAQGRNKPVKVGQVGMRCIHCKDLHPKLRTRASVYYPSRLTVLYQAAQNIVNVHLPELCESMPSHVRARLLSLDNKRSSVGGGKNYWSDTAKVQGVVDTEDGLRFSSSM